MTHNSCRKQHNHSSDSRSTHILPTQHPYLDQVKQTRNQLTKTLFTHDPANCNIRLTERVTTLNQTCKHLNIKCINISSMATYLSTRKITKLVQTTSPSINTSLTKVLILQLNSEQFLPFLLSYLHKVNPSHNHSVNFVTKRYMTLHTSSIGHIYHTQLTALELQINLDRQYHYQILGRIGR